ncbi:YegS/Rv2252/BmrU family lipid kinase [Peribacillus saganii]|uniref:YegS/Rv2252/BmrU family lipid kinase n=1 Tax=Peribacillus saganii TaxID=2303992 RepID=A0A372LLS5_9BACI|nr:YegS/Rv2252/BmrU family lipid kinase [Peribacillus saganii]RFU67401.1 YegS/Rv2252/BmrU family lipid kinase [Peribacillus saganii]
MGWQKGLLIYNEKAGNGNIEKQLAACLALLAPHISEFLLLKTQKQGDAANFCRIHGEEMDVVFVMGGDGTVHECINGLAGLDKRPLFGILPGGTCNDFSRALNIPQNIRRAAEQMVSGEYIEVDIGTDGNDYFLNFWGIGLITETSNNIDADEKNRLGKISYLMSMLRTVNSMDPFPFKIVCDGNVIEDEAVMILAANGKYIGTNQIPAPLIEINDGQLDIIIVKNSSLSLFREVLEMKRTVGEIVNEEAEILYFQTRSFRIYTPETMDADSDGEVYMKTPAEIHVLPKHIRMLCGTEILL